MKLKSKVKGYTLVELLIGTGVLSLAAIGVYTVAGIASDWRRSSQEVKSLNMAIKEIDNSTVTAGAYTGITLSSLNNVSSGISSNLQLRDVVSPEANKLNFVYADVNSRVCGDFTSKMLSSSNNIGAIINGKEINSSNLGEVVSACSSTGGLNNVTIVLNKTQDANVIDTVVASVNPPPPPVPDIVIPTFGGPSTIPSVPGFVPSTANPVTYPLITGTPPTFGPVVGGGGNVTVTSPGGQVTPGKPSVPTWIPPNVYRPPATPAPADALDQDPNPPPPSYLYAASKPIGFYRWDTYGYGSGSQWAWNNVLERVSENLTTLRWENLNLLYDPTENPNPRWLKVLMMRHAGSGNYLNMCPTLSYDANFNAITYPNVELGYGLPREQVLSALREYYDKVRYVICIEFGDDGGA